MLLEVGKAGWALGAPPSAPVPPGPLPAVKGRAIQQGAIVVVADKVAVLHHAETVGWTQQDAHLHRVCLVPHIQQDHVKVQGGIWGNEPRCGQSSSLWQP